MQFGTPKMGRNKLPLGANNTVHKSNGYEKFFIIKEGGKEGKKV